MMKSATKDKIYRSPVRKLARFFEKSRDQWKAKCREAKRTIKYLKNRVRFLEEGRDRWKSQAQELEARVKQMEAKERELTEQLEALESRETGKKTG
jgi:chromosome segregation ATPase